MYKRGQAALEFITTYGWAFIVILIMIGALSYWGVTNPRNLLPERCSFPSEFSCINHQLDTTQNTFKLRIRNMYGDAITAQNFKIASDSSGAINCTSPNAKTGWPAGNFTDIIWTDCDFTGTSFQSGAKAKVLVSFDYYDIKSGSGYTKPSKGEIITQTI